MIGMASKTRLILEGINGLQAASMAAGNRGTHTSRQAFISGNAVLAGVAEPSIFNGIIP